MGPVDVLSFSPPPPSLSLAVHAALMVPREERKERWKTETVLCRQFRWAVGPLSKMSKHAIISIGESAGSAGRDARVDAEGGEKSERGREERRHGGRNVHEMSVDKRKAGGAVIRN